MNTQVLILCTHNSARSILAEGMLNHLARARGRAVSAFSAGSAPGGRVNPHAIAVLRQAGVDTSGMRSKSWDEFGGEGASMLRVVITVCDAAAKESCPVWPGAPVRVHWAYPDPSGVPGDEAAKQRTFELTRQAIAYRMLQLVELPFDRLSDAELARELARIGKS